jgi:uncharacterized protein YkwD
MAAMQRRCKNILVALVIAMNAPLASAANCINVPATTQPPHVDMEAVRDAWLGWNNQLRQRLKLQPYSIDNALNVTAANWSAYSASRGTIDHKRTLHAAYYDYKGIEQWFADKGVTFQNVNGVTFTENVGWGPYTCSASDCTRQLIRALKSTYRYFASENGKKSDAHWRSLIKPEFTAIGVGVAISGNRYYVTIHYAAKRLEASLPQCKL